MKRSQREKIASYLKQGRGLTQMQALDKFGCARLASRIADLRADGMPIKTDMIPVKTRSGVVYVARYKLEIEILTEGKTVGRMDQTPQKNDG